MVLETQNRKTTGDAYDQNNFGEMPAEHICPLIKRCPEGAISQKGFKAPTIDQEKYVECLVCVKNCPHEVFQKVDD